MSHLIDRVVLAEEIESLQITVAGKPARWNDAKHSVLRIIGEQADVDAVEVVRCKGCHSCEPISGVLYCHVWSRNTVPDGFCHEGG